MVKLIRSDACSSRCLWIWCKFNYPLLIMCHRTFWNLQKCQLESAPTKATLAISLINSKWNFGHSYICRVNPLIFVYDNLLSGTQSQLPGLASLMKMLGHYLLVKWQILWFYLWRHGMNLLWKLLLLLRQHMWVG